MLTTEEAKRKGHKECIRLLGYGFGKWFQDSGLFAFGDEGKRVSCFIGIDTREPKSEPDRIQLTNTKFPYYAYLYVYKDDGRIEIIEVVKP